MVFTVASFKHAFLGFAGVTALTQRITRKAKHHFPPINLFLGSEKRRLLNLPQNMTAQANTHGHQ